MVFKRHTPKATHKKVNNAAGRATVAVKKKGADTQGQRTVKTFRGKSAFSTPKIIHFYINPYYQLLIRFNESIFWYISYKNSSPKLFFQSRLTRQGQHLQRMRVGSVFGKV